MNFPRCRFEFSDVAWVTLGACVIVPTLAFTLLGIGSCANVEQCQRLCKTCEISPKGDLIKADGCDRR